MARKKKRHPKRKPVQTGTVTMSLIVPFIGGIGMIGFMIPLVLSLIKAAWGGAAFFGAMDLLSIAMLLTVNWRIEYNSFCFTYRNCLRISRRYTYDQITAIHRDRDSSIRIGRKRIHIDFMADNGKKFLNVAMQHAKHAKCTTAGDEKLFRGNVRNPGEFIFIWVIIGAFVVGGGVMVIHSMPILHLEELAFTETVLSGMEVQESESGTPLLKLMQGETSYNVPNYEAFLTDFDGLKSDVAAGKTFRIYYEAAEEGCRIVRQISCGERVYQSIEHLNQDTYGIWALCGGVVVFWALYVAVSWYVMSHADRHPLLARLFVKPEYLVHKHPEQMKQSHKRGR